MPFSHSSGAAVNERNKLLFGKEIILVMRDEEAGESVTNVSKSRANANTEEWRDLLGCFLSNDT